MKTTISFDVDTDALQHHSDEYLAQLWHISQANPAPFGTADACTFAAHVGREIIRRWLDGVEPSLCAHQAIHAVHKSSEGGL